MDMTLCLSVLYLLQYMCTRTNTSTYRYVIHISIVTLQHTIQAVPVSTVCSFQAVTVMQDLFNQNCGAFYMLRLRLAKRPHRTPLYFIHYRTLYIHRLGCQAQCCADCLGEECEPEDPNSLSSCTIKMPLNDNCSNHLDNAGERKVCYQFNSKRPLKDCFPFQTCSYF